MWLPMKPSLARPVAILCVILGASCKTPSTRSTVKDGYDGAGTKAPSGADGADSGAANDPFAGPALSTMPQNPTPSDFETSPPDPFDNASPAAAAPAVATAPSSAAPGSAAAAPAVVTFEPPNVFTAPPPDALTSDTFYVIFWSYQRGANFTIAEKRFSHTFATFVHVRPGADGPQVVSDPTDPTSTITVSWMPKSGIVDSSLTASPEPGEATTLDFEIQRGARPVNGGLIGKARGFVWGPFRISADSFRRAIDQRNLLLSGRVKYKASGRDNARGRDYVKPEVLPKPAFLNCLAAVGDIAPDGGTRVFSSSGAGGTRELVTHFRNRDALLSTRGDRLIDRHAWVARLLNLARFQSLYPNGLELEDVPRR
jgi:hypothetical protein